MEKPDALKHFHGESRYNCAQAVLKAYAPWLAIHEGCLERFSRFGGGRAPGGECGALFAAKSIMPDAAAKQAVEIEFVLAAGSNKCREIRQGKQFTCRQCVQTAADAVFCRVDDGCILQPPAQCDAKSDAASN